MREKSRMSRTRTKTRERETGKKNCQLTVGHFSTNGNSLRRAGRSSYEKPLLIVGSLPFPSPLAASCSLVHSLAIRFVHQEWKIARRLVPDQ